MHLSQRHLMPLVGNPSHRFGFPDAASVDPAIILASCHCQAVEIYPRPDQRRNADFCAPDHTLSTAKILVIWRNSSGTTRSDLWPARWQAPAGPGGSIRAT